MKAGECCPDCTEGVAAARAELASMAPKKRAFDHQLEFSLSGREGDVLEVSQTCPYLFRGEKLLADDTVKSVGTKVVEIWSGNKIQRPPRAEPTLTIFFGENSLGCGVKYDTLQPGDRFIFKIQFLRDCEWRATLFGRAVES